MFIQLTFPSGRFYGARSDAPEQPEWPPHPSRLYSALVAAAYRSGGGLSADRRAALQWLEALPPPEIAAPPADLTPAPVTYVPPADIVGRKGKKGAEEYEHGVHRWRQPRHFPSAVILGEPCLSYGWRLEPDEAILRVLNEVARGVTHVGTSHAIAVVCVESGRMSSPGNWSPEPGADDFLRVPVAGRLAELDAWFEGEVGVRRPSPVCEPLVGYRHCATDRRETFDGPFRLMTLRVGGSQHAADNPVYLARAVRRAVMAVLGDDAPDPVHGHAEGDHVAWLPLPDVGHPHAKGFIVGLGLGLPTRLSEGQRQTVLAGLAGLSAVSLPDGRMAALIRPAPSEALPQVLRAKHWTGPATDWATVTPVVSDRPHKRPTPARLQKALAESLQIAGFPEPTDIELSPYSRFQGAPSAFRCLTPDRKPRYHAVVRFPAPVRGPVIAGRLRYFGVGLFRPFNRNEGGCGL